VRPLLFVLATCSCALAQTADSSLTFDVASVKVTGGSDAAVFTTREGSGASTRPAVDPILFTRRRATLASLLPAAYDLRPQQVIGPAWLTSERYDIMARVADCATPQQQLIMLRNLLAERFQVKLHREQRDLPVYDMVIAKGGSKLKQSGENRIPELTPDGPFQLVGRDGVPMIRAWGRGPLNVLAARLSRQSDRLILDRTGLSAIFDIDMRWSAGASAPSAGYGATDRRRRLRLTCW
jgi:bla regulator protein BlaR1